MELNRLRKKKAKEMLKYPPTPLVQIDLLKQGYVPPKCTRAFSNNRIMVTVYDNWPMTGGTAASKIMVQAWDDKPLTNHWRRMQDIKNTIFGAEAIGIEYYPPELELLDTHNIYWMFVFEKGQVTQPIM